MKTANEIMKSAQIIYDEAAKGLAQYIESNSDSIKDVVKDEAALKMKLADMESIIKGPTYNGISFPNFLGGVGVRQTGLYLYIKSKVNAEVYYNSEIVIPYTDNITEFLEAIANYYLASLTEYLYLICANDNLKEFNAVMDNVCKSNSIGYTVHFVVRQIKNRRSEVLHSIADGIIELYADVRNALSISDLDMFKYGSAIEDERRITFVKDMVSDLQASQTTVQLLKNWSPILSKITSFKRSRKMAVRQIREVYHKNLANVDKGLGYILNKYDNEGIESEYFMLLNKDGDAATVVLSPFDVNTLFTLKNSKEIIASFLESK